MESNTKELEEFREYLHRDEVSERTQEIYLLYAKRFLTWLNGRELTKYEVMNYKEMILKAGRKTATVNLIITAVNRYLKFIGYGE